MPFDDELREMLEDNDKLHDFFRDSRTWERVEFVDEMLRLRAEVERLTREFAVERDAAMGKLHSVGQDAAVALDEVSRLGSIIRVHEINTTALTQQRDEARAERDEAVALLRLRENGGHGERCREVDSTTMKHSCDCGYYSAAEFLARVKKDGGA